MKLDLGVHGHAVDRRALDAEYGGVGGRDDRSAALAAGQQAHFAEAVAKAEFDQPMAVLLHADHAVHDHEEGGIDVAFLDNRGAAVHEGPVAGVDQFPQLDVLKVLEERQATDARELLLLRDAARSVAQKVVDQRQVACEVRARAVAILQVARQGLVDDALIDIGNVCAELRQRRRLGIQDAVLNGLEVRGFVGVLAGQQLVAEHSEREQVGLARQLFESNLLRRHVQRGADPFLGSALCGTGGYRDAEVRNLDIHAVADEHVARLDITMDHATPMRVIERERTLVEDTRHLLERQQLIRFGVLVECPAARDVLHDDVVEISVDTRIVDAGDIGMPQHAGGLGLVEKQLTVALRVLVVAVLPEVRNLDRHRPVDERILRQVDASHVAGANLAHDSVLAEMPAFEIGGCLRLHCALETPEKRDPDQTTTSGVAHSPGVAAL